MLVSTVTRVGNGNGNPGIVPPWLQKVDQTPKTQTAGNGGIVPPWLADPPRILPWPWPDDEPHTWGWSNN